MIYKLKALLALLACAALLPLTGCAARRYETTYLGYFDTVTTVSGYFSGPGAAEREFAAILQDIERCHRICDAYNDYPGMVNIKTLNDNAGGEPLAVSPELMELLLCCKRAYEITGCVNIAMGGVLGLWHEAREAAEQGAPYLPDAAALAKAAGHTKLELLELDEAALTARIADRDMRLDVGAIAKGWAAGKAAAAAEKRGAASLLLSMGGNVCAIGGKPDGPWQVGVQDPFDPAGIWATTGLSGCLVTSGSYQRCFELEGVRYGHIIDPATLYPAARYESVSVRADDALDSALCDALSTALFILPPEEGRALAERCGAEAMWILPGGDTVTTAGWE